MGEVPGKLPVMFVRQAVLAARSSEQRLGCWVHPRRPARTLRMAHAQVPESPEAAALQAREATRRALAASLRQLRLELDTSLGDETFSRLKQTLPFLRTLCMAWREDESFAASLRVLLPDEGAAAALRKDWRADDQLSNTAILSIENRLRRKELLTEALQRDITCVVVAPRATEVDALQELARAATEHESLRLIVLNPELIDMGATGLGLSARRLRERLLNGLESVYYLRTTPWGLILRAYPERWSVWVDRELYQAANRTSDESEDDSKAGEFICIADDLDQQPSSEALTSLVAPYTEADASRTGPLINLQNSWQSLRRFLRALGRT
ncbi:hypothetical protein CCYA_CCYA04G1212 [Cyanidiococcus yangmingshanensis]|nr:hypothetical protein CCYA_CCYA04G1212 [Cyanidiococcus yangmingshanensis]